MTDDARLDEVQEHIDEARHDAVDAGLLEDPQEQKFHESGEIEPEADDQTIDPPG